MGADTHLILIFFYTAIEVLIKKIVPRLISCLNVDKSAKKPAATYQPRTKLNRHKGNNDNNQSPSCRQCLLAYIITKCNFKHITTSSTFQSNFKHITTSSPLYPGDQVGTHMPAAPRGPTSGPNPSRQRPRQI